jgi:hypothetical protein
VEHVDRLHRRWALLLEAKDQVDPLVEVGRHVVALQGLGVGGVIGSYPEWFTYSHCFTAQLV